MQKAKSAIINVTAYCVSAPERLVLTAHAVFSSIKDKKWDISEFVMLPYEVISRWLMIGTLVQKYPSFEKALYEHQDELSDILNSPSEFYCKMTSIAVLCEITAEDREILEKIRKEVENGQD